jgi:hypothetical protein
MRDSRDEPERCHRRGDPAHGAEPGAFRYDAR